MNRSTFHGTSDPRRSLSPLRHGLFIIALAGLTAAIPYVDAFSQAGYQGYSNQAQRTERLQKAVRQSGGLATVSSIGRSQGGADLWMVRFGTGDASSTPAILVVAGVDGSHLAGTEMAVRMVEGLAARAGEADLKALLSKTAIMVIPSVNPDAMETVTAKVVGERSGNARSQDDDRDGVADEDPAEDLNRDGLITWVRVEDPTGGKRVSGTDPRLMADADPGKGEPATHRVFLEGVDSDGDRAYNEDGAGGVNIDRNFAYAYPIFSAGAGDYAASEPETRALMDVLYAHPNILAVLTFGPENNLGKAPAFDASKAAQRIPKGVMKQDADVMKWVSDLYGKTVEGGASSPDLPLNGGDFAQTAYYHGGRFSFVTPGWWVPEVKQVLAEPKQDSAAGESSAPSPAASATGAPATGAPTQSGPPAAAVSGPRTPRSPDAKQSPEERLLAWADQELVDVVVPWTPIDHPDFPGRAAEVGGIKPYAMWNPPVGYLQTPAEGHTAFVLELVSRMPEVIHTDLTQESLGNGVHRITVKVFNQGQLPTGSTMGDRIRWNQKLVTEIGLGKGQELLSGRRIHLGGSLGAGESVEYSWLVAGKGEVTILTRSATIATRTSTVTLR